MYTYARVFPEKHVICVIYHFGFEFEAVEPLVVSQTDDVQTVGG